MDLKLNFTSERANCNESGGISPALGALAQMEREIIRNRVIAGLQNARAKGKYKGRDRKRKDALIFSLLSAGLSFREISRIAKCSHGSVSAAKKDWLAKQKASESKNPSSAEDTQRSSYLQSLKSSLEKYRTRRAKLEQTH